MRDAARLLLNRPYTGAVLLAIVAAVLAFCHSGPALHAWVAQMRAHPEVAAVEYTGLADAALVVVHLLDYHYCPPELCAAAGLDFERHLALVELVQAGQLSVAGFLVEQLGLAGVYQEGLTQASVPDWELRLGLLRDLGELERAGGLDDEQHGSAGGCCSWRWASPVACNWMGQCRRFAPWTTRQPCTRPSRSRAAR
jgi:hypothetical protein